MYFVYILKSRKNGDIYIGSTEDVGNRLKLHNNGKVKSTRFNRPWELMGRSVFSTRAEAVKQERFLKTGQQKERLRRFYL
jgi:putative endonuclease